MLFPDDEAAVALKNCIINWNRHNELPYIAIFTNCLSESSDWQIG